MIDHSINAYACGKNTLYVRYDTFTSAEIHLLLVNSWQHVCVIKWHKLSEVIWNSFMFGWVNTFVCISAYLYRLYTWLCVCEFMNKRGFFWAFLYKTVTSWRYVLTWLSSVQLQVECSLLMLCALPLRSFSFFFFLLISTTNSGYLFHIPSEYMYMHNIMCCFVMSAFKENKAETAQAEPTNKVTNRAPRLTSQNSQGRTLRQIAHDKLMACKRKVVNMHQGCICGVVCCVAYCCWGCMK